MQGNYQLLCTYFTQFYLGGGGGGGGGRGGGNITEIALAIAKQYLYAKFFII